MAPRLNLRSKNIELTDSVRQIVSDKFAKLERYHDGVTAIEVEIDHHKSKSSNETTRAEASIFVDGALLLWAESFGTDLRSALDILADQIKSRVVKEKSKQKDRSRVSAAKIAGEEVALQMRVDAEDSPSEMPRPVVLTESISSKPLSVDEAIQTLEETPKEEMLVFVNSEDSQVNVLRRQAGGNYLLYVTHEVEPED